MVKVMLDNSAYWNEYYKINHNDIAKETLFAQYVLNNWINKRKKLIEFGCGNGRDALYFCKNGLDVTAVDTSIVTVNKLKKIQSNCTFIQDDFVNSKLIYKQKYDVCYSRFTIHAISLDDEKKLYVNAYKSLEQNGIICIEVRSVNDPLYGQGEKIGTDEYVFNDHYRRFIRINEIWQD